MNRVSQARPEITPVHARLLGDVTALRAQARTLVNAHRRVGYVRPGTNEHVYLNCVSWCLEAAEALYALATSGHGSLALDSARGPDGFAKPHLILKPPPARVISLDAYRERRRAAAG